MKCNTGSISFLSELKAKLMLACPKPTIPVSNMTKSFLHKSHRGDVRSLNFDDLRLHTTVFTHPSAFVHQLNK